MSDYLKAHDILTTLGIEGNAGMSLHERIVSSADRLMMRPVGEPDTADLVGRINEICDRAGIADGDVVDRVEALQVRSAHQRHRIKELKADLEAERAQLDAKPARLDVLPTPAFIESLRSLGVVGDVTVRVTH